jgi:hypothetical protein
MITMMCRFIFIITLFLPVAGLCPARADDADAVKEKLFQAKKEFDAEVQKFKKAITEHLDKREDDARKAGNKKQVDQIKVEREAFEKTGEFPPMLPVATRELLKSARSKLIGAYSTTVKELVRLKMDDAATAIEKEQQEFLSSALALGRKAFLVTLKPFDAKVDKNWPITIDGTRDRDKIKINGELVPHTICYVPPEKGVGQLSYTLGGKWTVFQATIGVAKTRDDAQNPHSPLTFEVVGDGKSLWKSERVTKLDTFQSCTISVDRVKTLTLRVYCPGNQDWAWSLWIEPILVE